MWKVSPLLCSLLALGLASPAHAAERPNVVFFLVDDLGYMDIGANNPDTLYETPHIDRLAASGMRFTDGYAANPVCSPTRYSILTGRYPTRAGATNWFSGVREGRFRPAPLNDRMALEEVTLAEALREAGYRTFFAGKWHLGPTPEYWPEAQGFEVNRGGWSRGGPYGPGQYFPPYGNPRLADGPEGEHLPDRLASETIRFIEELTAGLWLALPLATAAATETTAELVAVLESDASVQKKALACRKLGETGTAEAVPALAALLQHEVLGTYARQGLERIPDPSASAALRAALPSTEGALRVGVIGSLGSLRDEQAVVALAGLVGDEDAAVSRAALLALGRVATPEAIQVVKKALAPVREGAASAALVAAERLAAEGQKDAAIDLYDTVSQADVSPAARVGATRGAIVTRGSVPFLMEQLDSDDEALRDVALRAIREMPSPALAAALQSRLAEAAPDLQVLLITALADCSNDETFAVLRPYLDAEAPATRRAALATASVVGDGPELAAALLDVASHRRSGEETRTALELLERMEGGAAIDEFVLARLAGTKDVGVRVDMIRVLGERRSAGAVDDLLALARDDEPKVRVAALRSMRRMVGPAEVPALIAVVEAEPDDTVRAAAIAPLVSACGDDPAAGELILDELKQATDPRNHDVWTRVITAVGYPGALSTVQAGLESDDPEVVAYTANRLADWPGPAPIESLLTVMEASTEPEVRRRTCAAVIQLTTRAAEEQQRPEDVLVRWFERASAAADSVQEKRQLVSGLARVHTLDSLRVLEPYVRDPEVQGEALYALLSIGSPVAKAGHRAEVAKLVPEDSAIEDQDLRWRVGRLRSQVEDAE